ncbi:hypothetical protein HGM15179_015857 [Zosterops borbonicus]|uniref:Integrase catalytic domain-containing protein n=1 Tax=Zosterops borbonicus TaxID=364589 RepID=A0A8K1G3R6_9PASS|nr:hypothetical protein HGM15179_015857 [Zosterops borbonicus]
MLFQSPQYKEDIKLLESIRSRAIRMGKGLEGKLYEEQLSLSRVRSEISRRADETPDPEVGPGVENPEWSGEWEDMGQTLKEFSDHIAWDFPCEHIQNPAVVGKYLKEKCQGDSKDKRIIAISWALAYGYRMLLDTVGQQREAGGQGDKSAATAVTQTAVKPDNKPKTAAKPDSESKTLAVACAKKEPPKRDQPVDDDAVIQLALDLAEREKWPKLYLYTDSWMVANALWGGLKKWKKANWQHRGKPIWAAEEWKDFATRVEKLPVKVRHVDAHVPKSRATEEHQDNEQVYQAAKIEVSKIDLDWQHKGELFLARWAHDASGHQGRDAAYKWARDRGVDLTMDSISQVIYDCDICAAIKQAKRVKSLWYGGQWSKYKYGEAWQIDYVTLSQACQSKRYVLTMVEATTGRLETYPVPHSMAHNTILGLEKQVPWRHGTLERIESDNGTHFKNNLINTWAREHGIEWVYHMPYHATAAGKLERFNVLLKTTLKALGGGSFKNWEQHLAKATWLVNTRGSTNRAGPLQSELLHTVDGDKVPVVHVRSLLGKTLWINSASSTDKPIRGIVFAQGPGCTWWVMQKDGTTQCVPQGDLIVG